MEELICCIFYHSQISDETMLLSPLCHDKGCVLKVWSSSGAATTSALILPGCTQVILDSAVAATCRLHHNLSLLLLAASR